jgi:hypothetical protein
MPTAEFKRPARFRLKDADAFLARHPDGVNWSAIPSGFGREAQTIFEYGDPDAERAASAQGYSGHWIDESEAQAIDERQQRITAAKPSEYPWDDWQRQALAAGVSDELANLGRAVMREADQHNWCDSLKYECGISSPDPDYARNLIEFVKEQPARYDARWRWLLGTDGLRFDPWNRNQLNESDHRWNDFYQRWEDDILVGADLDPPKSLTFDACRYVRKFYELDQLAIIDLTDVASITSGKRVTLYAGFFVVESVADDSFVPGVTQHGTVRVCFDHDPTVIEREIFISAETDR